jgi:uncharacterized protein
MKRGPDFQLERLAALCRQFGVRRLEVFGSTTSDAFDPQRSDRDFIVEFAGDGRSLFDDYSMLKDALQSLCGRPVALVMAGRCATRTS